MNKIKKSKNGKTLGRPRGKKKTIATYTISLEVKELLDKTIKKSRKSHFVEKAIERGLKEISESAEQSAEIKKR